MAEWLLSVDGREVRVRTRSGEPGVYDLQWASGAGRAGLTTAHSDRSPMTDGQLGDAVRALLPPADPTTGDPSGDPGAGAPVAAGAPRRAPGVVRECWDEQGWGVIDCAQTPGGCWTHFSAVRVFGYKALAPGQHVVLEWEPAGQDGYGYRAVRTWPVGQDPVEPVIDTDSGAYSSTLTIIFDAPRATDRAPGP